MRRGRPLAVDPDGVRKLREFVATPRSQRTMTLGQFAARLGLADSTAQRAAYGQRAYARVAP
jgi:hypothetical protein